MELGEVLSMWVIYSSPRDFPQKFVARQWFISDSGPVASDSCLVVDSKTEIYRLLPVGLLRLERDPKDEQQIIEMWI